MAVFLEILPGDNSRRYGLSAPGINSLTCRPAGRIPVIPENIEGKADKFIGRKRIVFGKSQVEAASPFGLITKDRVIKAVEAVGFGIIHRACPGNGDNFP
jgi:hypothetical protein